MSLRVKPEEKDMSTVDRDVIVVEPNLYMGDQSNENIIDVKTNNNSSYSKKELNSPHKWKPPFKQATSKPLDSEREATYMDYTS